ncbi:MAG: carbon-nitrogen hydrolase family protein [Sandaracinaceae bacterium]
MRVALAQIAPVSLDRSATLEKVVAAVHEAANRGAELVLFGESVVTTYPWWVGRTGQPGFGWDEQRALFARYLDQAIDLERGHLDPVRDAARTRSIAVVLGGAETSSRRGRSVFCAAFSIAASGDLVAHHRKLVPTHEERMVWAQGDAHGLRTHRVGPFVVGALNCWENWMPLARAALSAQGETLHLALWPGRRANTEDITRFAAIEGRSYVMSGSSVVRRADLPADLQRRVEDDLILDGGAAIAAPDGTWVIEPIVGEERVAVADLDPSVVDRARHNFDPAGHYARPEMLRLGVDRRRPGTELVD